MRKKITSLFLALCLLSFGSISAFAQEPSNQPVDEYGCTYSDYLNADPWWKDALLCAIEYGDGEMHILKDYTPQNSTPFLSFTAPYHVENIAACVDKTREHEIKFCESCGEKMLYARIVYEINPSCGHGIFSYGYYCTADHTFTPDFFYDQCGCYTHNIEEIHPYMAFVKEYLE